MTDQPSPEPTPERAAIKELKAIRKRDGTGVLPRATWRDLLAIARWALTREARIRVQVDQEWKDCLVTLCEAEKSWEANGFCLAAIVRMSAIRALAGTTETPEQEFKRLWDSETPVEAKEIEP